MPTKNGLIKMNSESGINSFKLLIAPTQIEKKKKRFLARGLNERKKHRKGVLLEV